MKFGFLRAMYFLLAKYHAYMGNINTNNKFAFPGLVKKRVHIFTQKYFNNINEINIYLNNSSGHIHNKDYSKILKLAKKNDFIFLDPPYYEKDKDYHFTYNKDQKITKSFNDELYNNLQILDKKGVKWMMTQADTNEIIQKFKKYKIIKFQVYRISDNTYKNELIIMNY
jgi:DNA adenine methylase